MESVVDFGDDDVLAAPPAFTLMLDDDDVQVVSEEPLASILPKSDDGEPLTSAVEMASFVTGDAGDETAGSATKERKDAANGGTDSEELENAPECAFNSPEDVSAKKLLFCMIPGDANGEGLKRAGLDEAEVFDMAMPAASRLARQVEMTLKHYQETLGNDAVSKIYVTGPMSPCARFVEFIGQSLGMPCDVFDPLSEPTAVFSKNAVRPAAMNERVGYNLALGLALSENASTPNLLNTYVQKRQESRTAQINKYMLIGCAAGLTVMAGLSFYQTMLLNEKKAQLSSLETQLATFTPRVDSDVLKKADKRAEAANVAVKEFAEKNQGLGVIGEAFSMLPDNVKLTQVNVDLGPPKSEEKDAKNKRKAAQPGTLTLEGLVTGDIESSESALAGYLVRLRSSPLFAESAVTKSERETLTDSGEETLRFVVSLALAEL